MPRYIVCEVRVIEGPNATDAWEARTASESVDFDSLLHITSPLVMPDDAISSPDFDVHVTHAGRALASAEQAEERADASDACLLCASPARDLATHPVFGLVAVCRDCADREELDTEPIR